MPATSVVPNSPGDEPRIFFVGLTPWVESLNPFFSEAKPFG